MPADKRLNFNVFELGRANRAELYHAIERANSIQGSFGFTLISEILPFDEEKYLQPNEGHDLDAAVIDLLPKLSRHAPAIVVTELPYTDSENKNKPGWFFFWDIADELTNDVSVVSTYLWQNLEPKRPLESYFLLFCATIAVRRLATLPFHTDTRGCLMDYCDDPDDIHEVLRSASLCGECSRMVERQIGSGRMSTAQAADIMRLLNRAAGRRCAFMAFPLKEPFVSIATEIVAPAVHSAGWHPILAAESVGGRDITDAIRRGIFMCDLIIADVTGRNPNVYWEFGFAYALGKDHILLCQNRRLPFDVAALRCIFYSANSDVERSKLTTDLCNHLRQ